MGFYIARQADPLTLNQQALRRILSIRGVCPSLKAFWGHAQAT